MQKWGFSAVIVLVLVVPNTKKKEVSPIVSFAKVHLPMPVVSSGLILLFSCVGGSFFCLSVVLVFRCPPSHEYPDRDLVGKKSRDIKRGDLQGSGLTFSLF